jgi:hypothetical protein
MVGLRHTAESTEPDVPDSLAFPRYRHRPITTSHNDDRDLSPYAGTEAIALGNRFGSAGVISAMKIFRHCLAVTFALTLAAKGTTTVSASRTTCGEALLCTGGNGKFSVSVVVK